MITTNLLLQALAMSRALKMLQRACERSTLEDRSWLHLQTLFLPNDHANYFDAELGSCQFLCLLVMTVLSIHRPPLGNPTLTHVAL